MSKPIVKSTGGTASEKYLSRLGEETFLNLWSYPNTFIDKKQGGKGDGKELCDLLVVCGRHILVFSDKTIAFQSEKETSIAWPRWYKAAITDSIKQVNGAIRWIKQFPNRIYLDRECTVPFPIDLPPVSEMKFHGVVVALGAKDACRHFFKGGAGSFFLTSAVKGDEHLLTPFVIGDVNPDGDFIHVLNDVTLDVVMKELDTITDLADYLDKKSKFIRGGHLAEADGEQDLLAYYLVNFSEDSYTKNFFNPEGALCRDGELLQIKSGSYADLYSIPQFIAKKEADRISYFWDRLIQNFTNPMLRDEMAEMEEHTYKFSESEFVLRHMAFENRFERRVKSIALDGLIRSYKKEMTRLCRALLPKPSDKNSKIGYVFLLLAYDNSFDGRGGYSGYRKYRRAMLHAYCLYHASLNLHLEAIVGIAAEPPAEVTGRIGSSEELLMVPTSGWTQEQADYAREGARIFNIGKPENIKLSNLSESEFPNFSFEGGLDASSPHRGGLNRHDRRALKAKKRRR